MESTSYYLVGIKGVAMTALAQVLLDAGNSVRGSDVPEDFVTATILQRLRITIDSFNDAIPSTTDQVIFTAAHQASKHPQVTAAVAKGIPAQSHAEALAAWFNQKRGVAVCGVGGKSTISAMISWILEKSQSNPSYAVGVGDIIGLGRTGKWSPSGDVFVAEADEYATDPVAVQQGEALITRFHYLKPHITVASTISFDHPDVYKNETHTRQVFAAWFSQLQTSGVLISSDENRSWLESAVTNVPIIWYGHAADSNLVLQEEPRVFNQSSTATFTANSARYTLTLKVPGTYNMLNALAAIAAVEKLGVSIEESVQHLTTFQSTKRRFEHVGTFKGVALYDDYAHHPRELTVVLEAARAWFGQQRLVVAFQPHTFSRTKALFTDFVAALSTAPELVLLDIFSSARESFDPSISSDLLVQALVQHNQNQNVSNVHTVKGLAEYCKRELRPGDVLLTLGAGDIYTLAVNLGVNHV